MKTKSVLLSGVALCVGLAAPVFAAAADDENSQMETVVVTGDRAHLIETTPSDTAFGLGKTLIETPRAITIISDVTLQRYGIDGIDALTAITPNSYTASYFGVQGSVNLRGTMAENYFRGFKRAENRGTYTTPIGDASQIEILRGSPSPIYGAGKIGGLLNFIPKTAQSHGKYIDETTGELTATYGSYEKRNVTGQVGVPLDFGGIEGGVYLYGELDDSHSYYRDIHPSHQLLEMSADFSLGAGWGISADYMYYHSNGDIQTPGWNRLTQDLIDHQTYITGRDTALTDTDGNDRITFDEMGGNPYTGAGSYKPLYIVNTCAGGACSDARHTLDVGVGTTKLNPRTIYVAKGIDFSNTYTHTGFFELSKSFSDMSSLKFQTFYDMLTNDRFVSYGYPAAFRTYINEDRISYYLDLHAFDGRLTAQNVAGVSFRYVSAIRKESFNSGAIALDRRDISYGATANDIIDSPFNTDSAGTVGMGWENNVRTISRNAGAFVTTDINWDKTFDLILGGRYDKYNVGSKDIGVLAQEAASGRGDKGKFTYTASFSYTTPFGLVPYVTHSKASAVEIGQAGDVSTSLLTKNSWLSDSFLSEAGLKFQLLDSHLVGSLSFYRQQRTKVSQSGGKTTVLGTVSKGEELEIRFVASENLSFTTAGSTQHSQIVNDTSFTYIPARLAGVSGVNGFGGTYAVYNLSTLPGWGKNYDYTLMPHTTFSTYATYTTDPFSWGEAGLTFGGTYVSKTSQTIPNPIVFHPYLVLNASTFVKYGEWEADINFNNLTDKLYFTPDTSTYSNLGALPSKGREWRLTLKRSL
jgi:iron complex outermembrane recepter protein